jgi:hypothetical protein
MVGAGAVFSASIEFVRIHYQAGCPRSDDYDQGNKSKIVP